MDNKTSLRVHTPAKPELNIPLQIHSDIKSESLRSRAIISPEEINISIKFVLHIKKKKKRKYLSFPQLHFNICKPSLGSFDIAD